MGLEAYAKSKATGGGSGNGAGSANLGNAALKVIEKKVTDGVTTIDGELLYDTIGRKAGDKVTVHYLAENAARLNDFLKTGMGSGQGSILILENCMNKTGGGPEDIVVRWLTTAISKAKSNDEDQTHANRTVEKAFLLTPSVIFNNPTPGEGEPKFIHFPLTAEKTRLKTAQGYKEYDRAWIMNKMQQVESHKDVGINAIALQPEFSVKVNNLNEAIAAVRDFVGNANGAALVRVRDENDGVATELIRADYKKTTDELIQGLKDANLMNAVPNEALDAEVSAGKWTLEVIPAIGIPYLGDTLQKLVKEISTKPLTQLQGHTITYGAQGSSVTESILVTLPTSSGSPFFIHPPVRTNQPRYSLRYMPSPHFDLKEPEKSATADAQSSAAAEAPAAGGENFSADDYHFEPADAQGNPADDAGNTAQKRRMV